MATVSEKSALKKAEKLLSRYTSGEWQACLAIVGWLRNVKEEPEKTPAIISIHASAAMKEENLSALVDLLTCGYPRLEIQAANKIAAMLSKKESDKQDSFESIIGVVADLWEQKKNFPKTCAALNTAEGRSFARDIHGLLNPTTLTMKMDKVEEFIEKYLKIDTKAGRRIYFKLNRAQRHYHRLMSKLVAGFPARGVQVDLLKARQLGMSTYHLALCVVFLLCHPHTNAVIVADKKENLSSFMKMIEIYFESLPFQPARNSAGSVDKGIFFARHGLDSTISFFTAGGDDPGTSRTIHFLFCTESAKWPGTDKKIGDNLDSLNAARVNEPFTFSIHETTADGPNWYHARYRDIRNETERRAPHGVDANHVYGAFYGWFWDDAYTLKCPQNWVVPTQVEEYSNTHKELHDFLKKYNYYHQLRDRLYWVHMKVKEDCRGDWDRFKKEYPANWMEAFSGSALNFFSSETLMKLRETCRFPTIAGDLYLRPSAAEKIDDKLTAEDIVVKNTKRVDSLVPLKIWEQPDPECNYIIGVDAASGTASHDPKNADFGVAVVYNQTRQQFEAHYRAIVTPEALAETVIMLSVLYRGRNGPFIIATRTDAYGNRAIAVLIRQSNQDLADYHVWQDQKDTDIFDRVSQVYGYSEAGGNNRTAIYSALREHMDGFAREVPFKWAFFDEDLLGECSTFILRDNKYQHANGEHDDLVTAAGLCIYASQSSQTPRQETVVGKTAPKPQGVLSDKFASRLKRNTGYPRYGGMPKLKYGG